jgi:hypothetical protein
MIIAFLFSPHIIGLQSGLLTTYSLSNSTNLQSPPTKLNRASFILAPNMILTTLRAGKMLSLGIHDTIVHSTRASMGVLSGHEWTLVTVTVSKNP